MGWGLPAAVGACLGKNKKNTICITGDGGLQMNIQELATVMHHNLPIKIFIYNNKGYLTIKQTQELGFKSRIMGSNKDSGLSFPDYSKVAKSMKINNRQMIERSMNRSIDESSDPSTSGCAEVYGGGLERAHTRGAGEAACRRAAKRALMKSPLASGEKREISGCSAVER